MLARAIIKSIFSGCSMLVCSNVVSEAFAVQAYKTAKWAATPRFSGKDQIKRFGRKIFMSVSIIAGSIPF
jgi:hypothetical protein